MKRLRWEREETQSRHPYRDTAVMYGILSGLIVLITALTNGKLLPGEVEHKTRLLKLIGEVGALPVAAAFFVIATGFSWWRLRKREEQRSLRP